MSDKRAIMNAPTKHTLTTKKGKAKCLAYRNGARYGRGHARNRCIVEYLRGDIDYAQTRR